MKAKDIKSFAEGEHCFGQILEINDEDVYKIVALQYLQFNTIEKERENEICEQCGGWNFYTKWTE